MIGIKPKYIQCSVSAIVNKDKFNNAQESCHKITKFKSVI